VLGADHPLAHAEDRVRWLGRQAATLTALLPASALVMVVGAPGMRAALLAGVIVEGWLLVVLSAAVADMRERTLDLIVEGRGSLPLVCVERRRARLLRPRHVRQLAKAIERLRREARSPYDRSPRCRPLYVPAVVRAVDADLAAAVRMLCDRPDAATVGRVERLLSGESSPLYGDDSRLAREELARIHFGADRDVD
jgi:hypothetical protein